MSQRLSFWLALAFAAVFVTTGVSVSARTHHSGPEQDTVAFLRNAGKDALQSPYFTNPAVCHDGWEVVQNYIVALEPWANSTGLAKGDYLLTIGGKPVGVRWSDAMPRQRPTAGVFTVEVDRGGRKIAIEVPCRDHAASLAIQKQFYRALEKGDLAQCIDTTNRVVAAFGQPIARPLGAAAYCLVAQIDGFSKASSNAATAVGEAVFAFVTTHLSEMSYLPRGVESERTNISDAISLLDDVPQQQNKQKDLRDLLATALAKERAKPNAETPPPPRSETAPPQRPESASTYGTAFVVDTAGLLITAHHLVEGATSITVKCQGSESRTATVQSKAPLVDLVVLKAAGPPFGSSLRLTQNSHATLGQRVMTVGFPFPEVMGAEPQFADGTVSGTSGPGGDASFLQISMPIQSGNSGGVLFDETGQILGVVIVAGAPAAFLKNTGPLAQGIHWATKAAFAQPLLQSGDAERRPESPVDRTRAIAAVTASTCMVVATRPK